jgi:hypothetical protein
MTPPALILVSAGLVPPGAGQSQIKKLILKLSRRHVHAQSRTAMLFAQATFGSNGTPPPQIAKFWTQLEPK